MADIYEITRRQLYILIAAASILSILLIILGFVLGRTIVLPERIPAPVTITEDNYDSVENSEIKGLKKSNQGTSSKKPFVDEEGLGFYDKLKVDDEKPAEKETVNISKPLAETIPSKSPEKTEVTTTKKVPPTPTPDLFTLAGPNFKKAYAVQVSSVKRKSYAEETKKKLEKTGFPVYISKIKFNTGIVNYRVRVGPYLNQEAAVKIREEIRKKHHLSPFVKTVNDGKK